MRDPVYGNGLATSGSAELSFHAYLAMTVLVLVTAQLLEAVPFVEAVCVVFTFGMVQPQPVGALVEAGDDGVEQSAPGPGLLMIGQDVELPKHGSAVENSSPSNGPYVAGQVPKRDRSDGFDVSRVRTDRIRLDAGAVDCSTEQMRPNLVHPPKASAGDLVAVISPSFAAPAIAPEVHEQAMRRIVESTGLVPVEYPTTRQLGASSQDRAADVNAAFANPDIRAVLATIGGEDQITVVPFLDPELVRADPKPFLGYSDNTNILSWLWTHGVSGFYGGSTQVHLGPGPAIDPCHAAALRAALLTGERLEVVDPGESEDIGKDWAAPAALTEYGAREPTESWAWAGPARVVSGPTWGGCIEVVQWILAAGRFHAAPSVLAGGVLLLEASEEIIPAREFGWILRCLGERGLLAAVDAVLVARAGLELRAPALSGRKGAAPRRPTRHRNRGRLSVQPWGSHLRRRAIRPHPPTMDPPLRRRRHHRRNRAADLGQLPMTWAPTAEPSRSTIVKRCGVGGVVGS